MTMRYDVIGLGVATVDFIGVLEGEPTLGMKQPLRGWLEAGGGPVATALVTLARLGLHVCMAGAVGNDAYGQRILADLHQEGVATDAMHIRPGSSHVAFALVEPGRGRRTIWWHHDPEVLADIPLDPALIASARALHLDTHIPEAALQAAQIMHAAGGLVMIDAERVKTSTLTLLPHCDIMIVSERFGREVADTPDLALATRRLHEQYGGIAVVTAGERGNWCVAPDDAFHTPAFAIDPVDTTGAGDVFHGAFLYGVLQGWNLRSTARFASVTAALKCRTWGGRAGIPTLSEIEQYWP